MKNNIMIIVLVTLVALGVIITVIIASVANNPEKPPYSSTDNSSYVYSEDPGSDVSLSGSGNSGSSSDSQVISNSGYTIGDDIVKTARDILDREEKVPFVENGDSLDGFDNSGFIFYVLRENEFLTCPRGLQEQTSFGRRLKYDELKRGDLVFFYNEDNTSSAGYGGIYTGNGTMIACLMPGTYVDEIDISGNYYREHFCCGVSLS